MRSAVRSPSREHQRPTARVRPPLDLSGTARQCMHAVVTSFPLSETVHKVASLRRRERESEITFMSSLSEGLIQNVKEYLGRPMGISGTGRLDILHICAISPTERLCDSRARALSRTIAADHVRNIHATGRLYQFRLKLGLMKCAVLRLLWLF